LYASDTEVSGTTGSDFRRSAAREPEALESFGVHRNGAFWMDGKSSKGYLYLYLYISSAAFNLHADMSRETQQSPKPLSRDQNPKHTQTDLRDRRRTP